MRKITKIKLRRCSRKILKYLLLTGAIYIAASSPYFALKLVKNLSGLKISKKKLVPAFYYLKKKNLIKLERKGHDVVLTLAKEGKRLAGRYQIDDLEIQRAKKWDKKYRLVIFDIPAASRMVRDIFRRKLKEFGFYPLQKSVWVHAFECRKEIELLREFLGLSKKQIQVLEITKLEDNKSIKKFFNLL